MQTVATTFTVSDYCAAIDRNEIIANKEYQRSEEVWPPAARSFLIETVLLGYPMPKVYLYQRTDIKSRKTIKEIVDGQQRSKVIHDFYHGKLALAKRSEVEGAGGKRYDELDETLKGRFLNYQISVDLFVSVTQSEIRETFRRINSYTVPLNPEEKRHARYQGAFKWFIHEMTHSYEEWLLTMGVVTVKQMVRMADMKLITEIVHGFLNGIKTTRATDLDRLYAAKDKAFPEEQDVTQRFSNAIDELISFEEIHKGPLMRPHVFYALMLAISQARQPLDILKDAFTPPEPFEFNHDIAVTNLGLLAQALEDEQPRDDLQEFVAACSAKTNVESQRRTRVAWLGRALLPALL
jgi:hypothetical protein